MKSINVHSVPARVHATLQVMASRMSYKEGRPISKSSLAKEVLINWVEENVTEEDMKIVDEVLRS